MALAEAAGRGGDVGDGGKEGRQREPREPERGLLKPTQLRGGLGGRLPGNPSTDVSASGMFVVSKL